MSQTNTKINFVGTSAGTKLLAIGNSMAEARERSLQQPAPAEHHSEQHDVVAAHSGHTAVIHAVESTEQIPVRVQ